MTSPLLAKPQALKMPVQTYRRPAMGLDEIVDARPKLTLEAFVEFFLGFHSLWNSTPPASGSIFAGYTPTGPSVAFINLYQRQRFSVFLAQMTANAELPTGSLQNTERFEVYISGDYFPKRDGVQLVWPDEIAKGDLAWRGFRVRSEESLQVLAGHRGAVFLSFRRGPIHLFSPTIAQTPESATQAPHTPAAAAEGESNPNTSAVLSAQSSAPFSGSPEMDKNVLVVGSTVENFQSSGGVGGTGDPCSGVVSSPH